MGCGPDWQGEEWTPLMDLETMFDKVASGRTFQRGDMSAKFLRLKVILAGALCAQIVLGAVTLFSVFAGRHLAAERAPALGKGSSPAGSGFTQPEPINFDDHDGWTQIFDGKSLNGWDGSSEVWRVEDDAIVGESSPEHPSGTTNIIWRGGEPQNFELKVEMKLEGSGANGGIQYRSLNVPPVVRQISEDKLAQMSKEQRQRIESARALAQKYARWNLQGYQGDIDYEDKYTGNLYEQATRRGIIAWRGQVVETDGGQPRLLATLGSADDLKNFLKPGKWNQYEVIADGNTLIHILNGHVMAVLVDNDPAFSQAKGLIGFEIEGPGKVKISQRNIWLKTLP